MIDDYDHWDLLPMYLRMMEKERTMAFTHKDGRGKVWDNKYKEPGDNKPSYKGNGMVGGVVWSLAIWVDEEDEKGIPLTLSIRFEEPQERPERQEELPIKKPVIKSLKELRPLKDELDDDIPF